MGGNDLKSVGTCNFIVTQLKTSPAIFVIAHFFGYTPADVRNPKMWYQKHHENDRVYVFVEFFTFLR